MASSMPKFLLGGINLKMNFLGSRTLKTAGYGLIEVGVKVSPLFIILGFSGKSYIIYNLGPQKQVRSLILTESTPSEAPQRRLQLE